MPVKASAAKALRQSAKREVRNRKRKRVVKELTKDTLVSITKKEADALKKVQQVYQAIDKAVKNGVMHANKAARKKSRLMKLLNSADKKSAEK